MEQRTFIPEKEFKGWAEANNLEIFDNLSDVMPDTKRDLHKGQICTVINGYGRPIPGLKIMGFSRPSSFGGCVHLNWDCFWYSKNPEDIISAE